MIDIYNKIAVDRGGKCLSKEYVNTQTKLKFECEKGHQWNALPYSIKKGQWCKKCSDAKRSMLKREQGLLEAKEYAHSKSGKCLSDEYKGSHSPLDWECEKGHQWKTAFGSIKHGKTWCPHCSNRAKLTIEQMRELAQQKGGKCLSNKYINVDTKLRWKCGEGHIWESIPYLIKSGSWCPKCNVEKRSKAQRLTIQDMHQLAESRNGKCLSKKYTNSQTHLLWECNNKHQWKSKPNNIRQGKWCPTCSEGLGERICRAFFQQLFDSNFDKVYPTWLLNEDDNQMELDGYSKEHMLAFEHQGGQHYYVDGFFIKTKEQLDRRKRNDNLKVELCIKNNITLIQIPEIPKHLKVEKLKDFIKSECLRLNVNLIQNFDQINVDLKEAYTPIDPLKELNEIAKSKGGICLSDHYLGTQNDLQWKCKEGHEWKAMPSRIKRGSWCPACAGTLPLSIMEMKELALSRGGKCLSEEYKNNNTNLIWECAEGHSFSAKASNVKSGTWCPECGIIKRSRAQRSDIKEMQEIAEKRNGKCVSSEYLTTHHKLTWECEYGHQWNAIPSAVRRGSWCPTCSGHKKPTIEDMQELASKKNGRCLSNQYTSTHVKLLWQCEKGHQWEARPSGIKSGAWCPKCSGNVKMTIEDMHTLAKNNEGKCLSPEYINTDTKLLWECKEGHQWKTIPYLVKKGSWCPKCRNRKRSR